MKSNYGFIRPRPGGGSFLAVKVQPRASKNAIGEPLGDELRMKVQAPPVDSAANEAVLELLAEVLGCPRGALRLEKGHTSRHKLISIQCLDPEEVVRRLALP